MIFQRKKKENNINGNCSLSPRFNDNKGMAQLGGCHCRVKGKREQRTKSVREVATHTDTATHSFRARTTLVWCVWSLCRAENCHTPSAYFDFWQHKVVQIHVPDWGGRVMGETSKSSRRCIIWEHVPDTTKRHQFDWFVAKFSLFLIYNQIHWATKLALCVRVHTQKGNKTIGEWMKITSYDLLLVLSIKWHWQRSNKCHK